MGIFSSLFGGNKTPEENKAKNFDILKYDGIRAMNIGKPSKPYSTRPTATPE